MRRSLGWIALALCGAGTTVAQETEPSPTATGQPDAIAVANSPEAKAILEADLAFVREYNQGDVKALAARFAEDAEVIEADGTRYRGRTLIERRLAETFAESPGVRLEIRPESIQLLSPDVVKEEGSTTVTPTSGAAEARRHTALLVKRDGRWLIASIREEAEPQVSPRERLKELEWMVGEWVDQGPDSHVRVTCRMSEDGNFLIRTFTVKVAGKTAMTVHQRIGWDPLAKHFRSWEFDSEGGYGEGRWSRDGDRWIIKRTGVRPDGLTASSTNIVARQRPDLVRWVSTDRVFGDRLIPEQEEYVMVRVPPAPRVPSRDKAASPAAAKAGRSER
jgi:uncharacterized protein (TIGR02246 family)